MEHIITELIEKKGISLEDLSRRIDISVQALYKIVSGRTKKLRNKTLYNISNELNIDIKELKCKHEDFINQLKQEHPSYISPE